MDRYSFLVQDFHLLLLTGLPAFQRQRQAQRQRQGQRAAHPGTTRFSATTWLHHGDLRGVLWMTNITWISIVKGK
jgi:hypothetical protein